MSAYYNCCMSIYSVIGLMVDPLDRRDGLDIVMYGQYCGDTVQKLTTKKKISDKR